MRNKRGGSVWRTEREERLTKNNIRLAKNIKFFFHMYVYIHAYMFISLCVLAASFLLLLRCPVQLKTLHAWCDMSWKKKHREGLHFSINSNKGCKSRFKKKYIHIIYSICLGEKFWSEKFFFHIFYQKNFCLFLPKIKLAILKWMKNFWSKNY